MNAICFDLDGTLIDPKLSIIKSIRYALKTHGIKPSPRDEDYYYCIGPPLLDSFEKLSGSRHKAELLLTTYRERFKTKGIYENKLYPGIPDLLNTLNSLTRPLYLATSKPLVYASVILEHLGILKYFDGVYGSELDGTRSDKTELLDWIITKEKLNRQSAIMIGDRKYDIIGAKNNDVQSIAVSYGYGTMDEITAAQPDKICNCVEEILPAVQISQS